MPSLLRTLALLALALAVPVTSLDLTERAHAEAPLQAAQVPGFYRVMVGTVEVTAGSAVGVAVSA
jgi:hypothetical protein